MDAYHRQRACGVNGKLGCRAGARFAEAIAPPRRAAGSLEEVGGVLVDESQAPREARILRTAADVNAAPGIQPVPLDEEDAEAGERFPAPAHRRTGGVRAVLDLDVDAELFAHAREHGLRAGMRLRAVRDLRLPRQAEHAEAFGL